MATLNKWAIFNHPKVNYKPHNGQVKVEEDNHRHQVVAAGRRWGKSLRGGKKLLPEAFFTKPLANQLKEEGRRREFWIVGPNFSDSEKEFRVIWNDLTRLEVPFDKPGSYNSAETGDMRISLWGGAFIVSAKSAQYPERLVGEGLSGVILSEAAKLKDKIWPKYIRPTLADYNGWSFHSSTPEGKNWFYDLWQTGQDPNNANWQSWRMPAWVNNYVYKTPTNESHVRALLELERQYPSASIFDLAKSNNFQIDTEILESINDLTPEAFLQEIAADFTEFVGRVFREFDEETHVTDLEFHPGWQTVAAVDYGFTNPNVWLLIQIGPWGEINVLDEVYEQGLDPTEFAHVIKQRQLNPPGLHYFYPDPASPGDTRILEKALGIKARPHTGGELSIRINHIRKALRERRTVIEENIFLDEGFGLQPQTIRPQLMFDRKCVRSISDFLNYRYPERKEESSVPGQEKPMKKADHAPEALGRMFAGIFGDYTSPHGPRVVKADMGRTHKRKVSPIVDKDLAYRRPALHERLHSPFPRVNTANNEDRRVNTTGSET